MPQVFESVKEEYLSLKLTALKKHKSQSQRDYMRPERLRAVAQFRGQQVNSDPVSYTHLVASASAPETPV